PRSPCRLAPASARSRPAGTPQPPGPPPQRRAQTYAFSEDLPVEMRRHPDVGDGADEKGDHEDPRRPVDLALEAAPRAVAAPDVAATADGAAKPRRLRCLDEDSGNQDKREHGLGDDQRVLELSHGTRRFYRAGPSGPDRSEPRVDRVPVQGVEPGG